MQNALREDWRAGYAETCKSGSEGSTAKPNTAMYHGRVALTLLFLPGTTPTVEGGRQAVYNNKDKGHEKLFHEVAAQHFEVALDEIVGPSWRSLRQEPEIVPELPDVDDLNAWFPREREEEM